MIGRRLGTLLVTLLCGVAGLVLSSAPAIAADGGASVSHVQQTDGGLRLLVSVPADADVDLGGVEVQVDGAEASATAEPAGSGRAVRRTAVLVMDTSNSMEGERIEAAKAAALAYVDALPRDVYLAIVTFDSDVATPLRPSRDRQAALDVINGITLSQGTLLYDGVTAAIGVAGAEGQRSLLVLSDGADTGTTDLADVSTAVTESEVLLDVVAVDQSGDALEALEALAGAAEGRVLPADTDALAETFSQEAQALARQVLVDVRLPDSVTAAEGTVRVTMPSARGDLTAQAFTMLRAGAGAAAVPPAPVAASGGSMVMPDWVMYVAVGAVGLGLLALLVLLVPRKTAPLTGADLVATYTASTGRRKATVERSDAEQALQTAKDAAAGILERNRSLEARIAQRLDGAGSELKPAEWLLVHAAVTVAATLVGLLVGRGNLVIGLIALGCGLVIPWWYLGFKRSRRRRSFENALPDTLQLISGSLTAGLSLQQAVDAVVRDGVDPIASEFRRVLVETRLGVSLEDAMDGVAQRFESRDFGWVVMAIKIQRQVGGNLAELLTTVGDTMRERAYIRRQVAALAAEGKLSAVVLALLPPLFLLYLVLTNGDYVAPLFTDVRGIIMLAGGALWLGLGVFWMSRLIKVDV